MKIKSYLPVFPGFYETIFTPDEEGCIDDDKIFDNYEFDYRDYFTRVSKACVNAIENQLIDLGFKVSIEFENLASPREYNFSTDCINVTYKVKPGCTKAIDSYLVANSENFATFLKDRYTSCSGFISNYPNYIEAWLVNTSIAAMQGCTHYLGTFFEFILQNEGYDHNVLYDDIVSDTWLDAWLKEPEEEPEEIDLGKTWSYVSFLDQACNYIFNPNQYTLKF